MSTTAMYCRNCGKALSEEERAKPDTIYCADCAPAVKPVNPPAAPTPPPKPHTPAGPFCGAGLPAGGVPVPYWCGTGVGEGLECS